MKSLIFCIVISAAGLMSPLASAKKIMTNAVVMDPAPEWVTMGRVDKIVQRIQTKLEWTVRRIKVKWYSDQKEFEASHNLGPAVRAVTFKKDQRIYLGPRVTKENFDQIFAHELVHVISFQKYKASIPKWLEEGLANHLAKKKPVDYTWLAKQPFPQDVRSMTHPLKGSLKQAIYKYVSSQALAEMLDKKCKLERLLQLSVERNMNDYIKTFCEISDLTATYKEWVTKKAKAAKAKNKA
ncbi:MAG: hypothetical protein AAF202_07385 [Pseudomonadota bacterium]